MTTRKADIFDGVKDEGLNRFFVWQQHFGSGGSAARISVQELNAVFSAEASTPSEPCGRASNNVFVKGVREEQGDHPASRF